MDKPFYLSTSTSRGYILGAGVADETLNPGMPGRPSRDSAYIDSTDIDTTYINNKQ